MDRLLRRVTPIVLVVLAGLVWFERALPGSAAFREAFGPDAVPRFVTGVLCIYVLLLVLERQRMEQGFKDVLAAFREFHGVGRGGDGKGVAADSAQQREALVLLVGALESDDAEVRTKAAAHLHRLTGQQLGEDAVSWRRWLQENPPG